MRPTALGRLAALACFALSAGSCSDAARTITQPEATPRPTAHLAVIAGDGQSGAPGQPLPQPVFVRVVDAAGTPVAGAAVTWQVAEGGGRVGPVETTTSADGYARAVWTLGPGTGQNRLTVGGAGETLDIIGLGYPTLSLVTFTVVKVSGDAQTGPAGRKLPTQLLVRAVKPDGTPAAGIPVSWTSVDSGYVSAPLTETNFDGMAWGDWYLGPQLGVQAATVHVGDVTARFTATANDDTTGTIRIFPQTLKMWIGDQTHIGVYAYDQWGTQQPGPIPATWSSSRPSVIAVDDQGTLTALASGVVWIHAEAGGKSDSIQVESRPYAPPAVTSITINHNPMDVVAGSAKARFFVQFSRAVTGMTLRMRGPLGTALDCPGTPTSGYNSATFFCQVTVPQGVDPGAWKIEQIASGERLHGGFIVTYADLHRAGVFADFTVISNQDVTAPTVYLVTNTEPDFLTEDQPPGTTPITVRVSDAESGVKAVSLTGTSPSGTQTTTCDLRGVPFGGNPADGYWFCWVPIPPGAERGWWSISIVASDVMRNQAVVTSSQLRDAGLIFAFHVN